MVGSLQRLYLLFIDFYKFSDFVDEFSDFVRLALILYVSLYTFFCDSLCIFNPPYLIIFIYCISLVIIWSYFASKTIPTI